MRWRRAAIGALVVSGAVACGGGSSSSTGMTPTPVMPPAASTFTLTGLVTDDAGQALSGVAATILDGANTNRITMTDGSGRYTMTTLSSGGLTVRFQRTGYADTTRPVTLTSDTTLNVTMTRSAINLSGAMSGTFAYTNRITGQPVTAQATAMVTQNGTAISGTLNMPQLGWTGSFTGTLSSTQGTATYTGSLTLSALISTGSGRCNGTRSTIVGTATGATLVLPAPQEWLWNECNSSVNNLTISLSK